jgi:hypothetical protein
MTYNALKRKQASGRSWNVNLQRRRMAVRAYSAYLPIVRGTSRPITLVRMRPRQEVPFPSAH